MIEIWRAGGSSTRFSAAEAQATEAEGWDGQMFMDSQSLSHDPYVQMGAWAAATTRLKLSPGVTNPLTRNLAVTAAGMASVQAISGGRAVLGIGRGDSALAYLGLAPMGLAAFEAALVSLQALLSGEAVEFDATGQRGEGARGHETLSLGARPEATRLQWLGDAPKVPLDVAATGPKVIAMGARLAERMTFSVGAEEERIGWALAQAHTARAEAGMPAAGLSCGAQVVVACHPDRAVAMELAMRFAPPFVRFQVMQGSAAGPSDSGDATSYRAAAEGYDMTRHSSLTEDKLSNGALTPEFVSRFAIAGPPDYCARRLLALRDAGLERFVVVGPGFYPPEWGAARDLFAREVIPAVRG
jgi:5,10-methylenetetrahydromethanopterin reductase